MNAPTQIAFFPFNFNRINLVDYIIIIMIIFALIITYISYYMVRFVLESNQILFGFKRNGTFSVDLIPSNNGGNGNLSS